MVRLNQYLQVETSDIRCRVSRHSSAGLAKSTPKSVRPAFLRLSGCFIHNMLAVLPVVEAEATKVPGEDGNEVTVPVLMTDPNPNGEEFDNLYLDMNGIVCAPVRMHVMDASNITYTGSSLYASGGQGKKHILNQDARSIDVWRIART